MGLGSGDAGSGPP